MSLQSGAELRKGKAKAHWQQLILLSMRFLMHYDVCCGLLGGSLLIYQLPHDLEVTNMGGRVL